MLRPWKISKTHQQGTPLNLNHLQNVIQEKREAVLALHDQCGKKETTLESRLYSILDASTQVFVIQGLFGYEEHRADRLVTVGESQFVCECKKVTEGTEHGYWHALIQAQIYRHRNQKFPVVCIVFDWGRLAGKKLEPKDSDFLLPWTEEAIYFVRISLADNHFIEHNLNNIWEELR